MLRFVPWMPAFRAISDTRKTTRIQQSEVLLMKDWQTTYKNKLVSAEQALQAVKSGDRVVFGHACSEPPLLVKTLVDRAPELSNVEIFHMVAIGPGAFAQPGMEKSFRFNTTFLGTPNRKAIQDGRGTFTPCFFSEVPRLFKRNILPVDVMLIQVTPPDEQGYCSYGLSGDYTQAATENAKIVIAEMNTKLPHTGGIKIHLDALTWIVENDSAIKEVPAPKFGEVERQIGLHVASLVPDGATLQLGIGGIPEACLLSLTDKKDLGIHSEMFSDAVVTLVEAGVITNTKKTLNPGKFIVTFLVGTNKLYNFVNNNPNVELHPVDYTNDPYIIGQHDNMISINSALQVDLTGQVNAEMIGDVQYSGIGGQVDFVRGAGRSNGGKSIIAIPSTASKGTISRICRELDRGAAVSTSRNDVHYIVTEYGVADLRGKTLQQRSEALIAIAHPNFREALKGNKKVSAANGD
jgi:4-hydroxybutyrate CoA-transferase